MQLAVDDFGTGYSSLNYIRRFPVDILKVDKSFMDGVNEGGEDLGAHRRDHRARRILNLKPVAEGIERADQLERLLELNCDLGQGFFFAKPLPGMDLGASLSRAPGGAWGNGAFSTPASLFRRARPGANEAGAPGARPSRSLPPHRRLLLRFSFPPGLWRGPLPPSPPHPPPPPPFPSPSFGAPPPPPAPLPAPAAHPRGEPAGG